MAESCPTCGQAVDLHTGSGGTSCYVKAAEAERDSARRFFNRLDAAISHHRKGKDGTGRAFADDADDALHAAHDRILKEAANGR